MKSNMWKSTFREIKQSFGRFMAIFAIIALGVCLFSGLKVLQPAMVKTTDDYLKEKTFYNYRILSSLGFEQEDLEFLAMQEDVRYAEGIVSFDMLCGMKDQSPKAVKIYSLPEKINGIELKYGRMPTSSNECLIDSAMNGEEKLGQKIYLSADNEGDDLDHFKFQKYTVVGIVQSSGYIQSERGTTSIGNGKIAEFMYIPLTAFDVDFYTEILVKFEEDYKIYSDEYDSYMDAKEPVWERLAEEAAAGRYDRLMAEAEGKLNDAKLELADGKAEGEAELKDAEIELADAFSELSDGEKELADAKIEISDGRETLEENRDALTEAEYEIAYNRRKLEDAEKEITENKKLLKAEEKKLNAGKKELNKGQKQLDKQKKLLPITSSEELETLKKALEDLKSGLEFYDLLPLEEKIKYLESVDQVLGPLQNQEDGSQTEETPAIPAFPTKEELQLQFFGVEQVISTQLEPAIIQIEEAQAEIDENRAQLENGEKELNAAKKKLEKAEKEIIEGKDQLEHGLRDLRQGWTEFSEGEAELLEGEAELADAEKELADGWKEYYDGYEEYEEGYQEFITEIADAEEKIADAEADIADIERPESYVLGRETNVGYVCMENDSAIVDGIANVFPVFFYAVAALVCITTMNRMIEEQRTQIGVLKALGYSEASIMGK